MHKFESTQSQGCAGAVLVPAWLSGLLADVAAPSSWSSAPWTSPRVAFSSAPWNSRAGVTYPCTEALSWRRGP